VQVDPIKPTFKAPGTKRLKLKYDESVSNFAFKFNLRRYNQERERLREKRKRKVGGQGLTFVHFSAQHKRLCVG